LPKIIKEKCNYIDPLKTSDNTQVLYAPNIVGKNHDFKKIKKSDFLKFKSDFFLLFCASR